MIGKKITELQNKTVVRNNDLFIVADQTDLSNYKLTFTVAAAAVVATIDFSKYNSNYTTTNTYSAGWVELGYRTAALNYGTLSLSADAYLAYDSSSNKVGIGTTTPNNKLTVVGSISATNNITAANISATGDLSAVGNLSASKAFAGTSTVDADTGLTLATKDYLLSSLTAQGPVVQYVYTYMTLQSTGIKAKIPIDDTIPQITEGTQIMKIFHTPKSTTNQIIFDANILYTSNDLYEVVFAVFADSSPDAIYATWGPYGAACGNFRLSFVYTPGTTSQVKYTIRAGSIAARGGVTDFRLNSIYSSTNNVGSAGQSSILITEIQKVTIQTGISSYHFT